VPFGVGDSSFLSNNVPMADFDDVVTSRRSVRGFTDQQIPRERLEDVFALAQRAPSNCNVQPWRVFVASGDRCRSLSLAMTERADSGDFGDPEDLMDGFAGDHRRLQIECASEMYSQMGVARGDMAGRLQAARRNFELFDAPHVAIVCMLKQYGLGVALDVGMYVQTLMLAMSSRGIGSCAQASLRQYPTLIRGQLGIADDLRIMCGVSFGYEDVNVPANRTRQRREPLASNVTFYD
jgi:hypothetical protein